MSNVHDPLFPSDAPPFSINRDSQRFNQPKLSAFSSFLPPLFHHDSPWLKTQSKIRADQRSWNSLESVKCRLNSAFISPTIDRQAVCNRSSLLFFSVATLINPEIDQSREDDSIRANRSILVVRFTTFFRDRLSCSFSKNV